MNLYREVPAKTNKEVAAEWDILAPVRHRQLLSGDDVSFNHLLAPTLIETFSKKTYDNILDAGCGTGVFTDLISRRGSRVHGIDVSGLSIEIARQSPHNENVRFSRYSIERYALRYSRKYDLVVSNMVMMDVMKLEEVAYALGQLCRSGGELIFSLTHPWFWPSYYGYEAEPWFDYSREIFIEGPFRISSDRARVDPLVNFARSTHAHRPISMYMETFVRNGFVCDGYLEPMPKKNERILWPTDWDRPRYLVVRFART